MPDEAAPPRIEIVVAAARNGVIGRDNALPWHLPTDLKRFRRLTLGRPIVMGRKTQSSIGRVLDGRANIVVTRDPAWSLAGVVVAHSVEEALELGRGIARRDGVEAVMVTGGAEIYRAALPFTEVVHLTEVDLEPDGDARFPPLDPAEWEETAREAGVRSPRDDADFVYATWRRRARPAGA
jgi:dihydrofolate reductase